MRGRQWSRGRPLCRRRVVVLPGRQEIWMDSYDEDDDEGGGRFPLLLAFVIGLMAVFVLAVPVLLLCGVD